MGNGRLRRLLVLAARCGRGGATALRAALRERPRRSGLAFVLLLGLAADALFPLPLPGRDAAHALLVVARDVFPMLKELMAHGLLMADKLPLLTGPHCLWQIATAVTSIRLPPLPGTHIGFAGRRILR